MLRDKATLEVGGVPLAVRVARALAEVAYPVLAVGIEAGTGLDVVDDPREGPLVALAAAAPGLRARGATGGTLVVACDLPFVEPALLSFLAASLGDAGDAVVPMLGDRAQSLCACYSARAMAIAEDLAGAGARAMRDLLAALEVRYVPQEEWVSVAPPRALADVDTPEDLRALSGADAPENPRAPDCPARG